MELIDTHTHIYLDEFSEDLDMVMERARLSGVTWCLLPAIDSTTHERMIALQKAYPLARPMMGVHPCSVKQDYQSELDRAKSYLGAGDYVAVGEIGLDFYWDKTFTDQQYAAFHEQCTWARELDLPIVIHSRNATDECIEVIAQYPGTRGVFHCFSGNREQAKKIMAMGYYLGIGGVVTFKNSGLDKVVQEVGIEQVVLETDAPYLAPVPYRGKRNEPAYTRLVAEKIASLLAITLEEVAQRTTVNATQLFGLK